MTTTAARNTMQISQAARTAKLAVSRPAAAAA
jgi:hypothetical protein